MARYVEKIDFVGEKEELKNQIEQYLMMSKFYPKVVKGEHVFQKGSGWLVAPVFIKLEYLDDSIILSAFMKTVLLPGVYLGESGIDGFYGALPKQQLKENVAMIQAMIHSKKNAN